MIPTGCPECGCDMPTLDFCEKCAPLYEQPAPTASRSPQSFTAEGEIAICLGRQIAGIPPVTAATPSLTGLADTASPEAAPRPSAFVSSVGVNERDQDASLTGPGFRAAHGAASVSAVPASIPSRKEGQS